MERFSDRKQEHLPTHFYNIKADLPLPPKPPLHPGNGQPIVPADLRAIFPAELIERRPATKGFCPSRGPCSRPMPSTGPRRWSMPPS